jgi:uncharacterized cofD-like protein
MKRVVTIGGGTGTFVLLSGLKRIPGLSLTAIVSSADDGGSTGRLRDAYGFLPLGDARQALVALADGESTLRDLFSYRFSKGDVKGHNLGNLFLTALTDLLGTDSAALQKASDILRVAGRVVPASEESAVLMARLADGSVLRGENAIDERDAERAAVSEVFFEKPVPFSAAAKEAIADADYILLGPGDLFTSTAAALLAEGMKEAVASSKADVIYVVNLFTKAGQTNGRTAKDHVTEVSKYAGRAPTHVLMHTNGGFEEDVLARYQEEGEFPIEDDLPQDESIMRTALASVHMVPPLPEDPVPRSLVRHDSGKLAEALARIFRTHD